MSALRMTVFLGVVITLTAGLHYYLWLRLVKSPVWPAPWRSIGTWLLAGLALSIPSGFMLSRVASRELASPLAWISLVWMGTLFLLVVALLPAEGLRFASSWLARGDEVANGERRQFLSRAIAATALGGAGSIGAFGVFSALRDVAVKRVSVPIGRLPAPLAGLRIAQLTDVHVGPTIGREFIEQLVRTTNALEPDLIAITGDLVDGSVDELREHVAPLAQLRARHGVFFVTGNHEYYSGADEWIAHLRTLGITVLENERVRLEHEGASFDLAGVHDWQSEGFGHGPDLVRAVDGRDAGTPLILLAHQPKQIEEAAEHGVSLQISGHTHGGQIFPFNYFVRLQQPYVAGLHDHEGTKLYVSQGTGYWGPPMRVGIPAEITEIVLAVA